MAAEAVPEAVNPWMATSSGQIGVLEGIFQPRTSLSVEHWEETCDYYMRHFPFDTYGRKWRDRKGRAIHTQSDFMRPLYEWGDTLFANAVKI